MSTSPPGPIPSSMTRTRGGAFPLTETTANDASVHLYSQVTSICSSKLGVFG
jgi:hypothetical protein